MCKQQDLPALSFHFAKELMMSQLTCFKSYDIRGKIGIDIDEVIAYKIGRAVAQHFAAENIVIGRDARASSPTFSSAVSDGVCEAGANVIDIGLCGTEEMYWAVTEFAASAGLMVTASHNPEDYNGIKIVKSGSKPLDQEMDYYVIKELAEIERWTEPSSMGSSSDLSEAARSAYVSRVLSFIDVDLLQPLKIVINSGNGAAGPTFDAIEAGLRDRNSPLSFVRVNHEPDCTFPNGIPNPMLPQNHSATADVVNLHNANFGVAFDGDFDRCFLFDEKGSFIPGEYIVGLLASLFLQKEKGAKIVHDPRIIWNTQDIIKSHGGFGFQSKTGHAFVKRAMRDHNAIYGGEVSAHHYFRDFAFCDSGMIPWLLIAEQISRSGVSLGGLVEEQFAAYPSSGEINFQVNDVGLSIKKIQNAYADKACSLDMTDGLSIAFENWRFNLRASNTEPLLRLNVEARGSSVCIEDKVTAISRLLRE
jgi:phosphomannomutase